MSVIGMGDLDYSSSSRAWRTAVRRVKYSSDSIAVGGRWQRRIQARILLELLGSTSLYNIIFFKKNQQSFIKRFTNFIGVD